MLTRTLFLPRLLRLASVLLVARLLGLPRGLFAARLRFAGTLMALLRLVRTTAT